MERDEAIHLVESREATQIRAVFEAARQATQFDNIEAEYRRQIREQQENIEELQVAVHHLNNIIHPIPTPDAPVEEDPNVLVAMDDGIEEDAPVEPEDQEIEPFEDELGDGVSDVDSDHSKA